MDAPVTGDTLPVTGASLAAQSPADDGAAASR